MTFTLVFLCIVKLFSRIGVLKCVLTECFFFLLQNSVPYLRVFLFHQQQFIKRYMQALAKKKQQQSAAPSSAQQANVPTSSTAVSSSGGGIEMVNLTASINNLTNAKLSDLQRQQILMNLTPEQRKTVQLALLKQQQKKGNYYRLIG